MSESLNPILKTINKSISISLLYSKKFFILVSFQLNCIINCLPSSLLTPTTWYRRPTITLESLTLSLQAKNSTNSTILSLGTKKDTYSERWSNLSGSNTTLFCSVKLRSAHKNKLVNNGLIIIHTSISKSTLIWP